LAFPALPPEPETPGEDCSSDPQPNIPNEIARKERIYNDFSVTIDVSFRSILKR
jgi:hypothetical protein